MSIDATEHISDQSCKVALLMGKSKYNSYFNDYASSTSSSGKGPKQLTNQVTHTLQQYQLRVYSSEVNIHQFDKENNDYYSAIESSNDQKFSIRVLEMHT